LHFGRELLAVKNPACRKRHIASQTGTQPAALRIKKASKISAFMVGQMCFGDGSGAIAC
jgi:hypothetical protein